MAAGMINPADRDAKFRVSILSRLYTGNDWTGILLAGGCPSLPKIGVSLLAMGRSQAQNPFQ